MREVPLREPKERSNDPILEVDAYYADAHFYSMKKDQKKWKRWLRNETFQSHQNLPLSSSPNLSWTLELLKPIILEVPKKGKAKKHIIFVAWEI